MPNNDHTNDNQGNGGNSGRFAGGDAPGGKKTAGTATGNSDHIQGTDDSDDISGLAGDDVLIGHQGDDSLNGGDGDDNIGGGAGDDILSGDLDSDGSGGTVDNGGTGADTFSHSGVQAEDGTDTILDFDFATDDGSGGYNVTDVIELDVDSFDASLGSGGVDEVELAGFLNVTSGGVLQSDLDGGADGFEDIVNVGTEDGVAVEINDQTFVWDGTADAWVEVA